MDGNREKKKIFKNKTKSEQSVQQLNLTKQEKNQIKKRSQKKDIVLDLKNKYKDYETEAVMKNLKMMKRKKEKIKMK